MRFVLEDARSAREATSRMNQFMFLLPGYRFPALTIRERPVPSWIPFTTGTGTVDENNFISPVRHRRPIAPATKRPAEAVSAAVKGRAMAMAAMAFIGWTGRGMPKRVPVMMLARLKGGGKGDAFGGGEGYEEGEEGAGLDWGLDIVVCRLGER